MIAGKQMFGRGVMTVPKQRERHDLASNADIALTQAKRA
jgi:hypothetical protein